MERNSQCNIFLHCFIWQDEYPASRFLFPFHTQIAALAVFPPCSEQSLDNENLFLTAAEASGGLLDFTATLMLCVFSLNIMLIVANKKVKVTNSIQAL